MEYSTHWEATEYYKQRTQSSSQKLTYKKHKKIRKQWINRELKAKHVEANSNTRTISICGLHSARAWASRYYVTQKSQISDPTHHVTLSGSVRLQNILKSNSALIMSSKRAKNFDDRWVEKSYTSHRFDTSDSAGGVRFWHRSRVPKALPPRSISKLMSQGHFRFARVSDPLP